MPTTGATLRVVVLADTHLRLAGPTGARSAAAGVGGFPEAAWSHVVGADAILHAGDVLDQAVLDLLSGVAPLYAVLGNNDLGLTGVLPPVRTVDLGGLRLGLIHDSGPTQGRPARLRRRFPDCDVVVFGHSHVPVDEEGVDGQRLFNPGSPTQRRTQPFRSLGELRIGGGALIDHTIIRLPDRRPRRPARK